jgi:hypothetical protein
MVHQKEFDQLAYISLLVLGREMCKIFTSTTHHQAVGHQHLEFDENFLADLMAKHVSQRGHLKQPTLTTASDQYSRKFSCEPTKVP